MILTEGTVADSTQARSLTEDLPAEYLLADKGYDTNAIVAETSRREWSREVYGRVERKLFADVAGGQPATSLKS